MSASATGGEGVDAANDRDGEPIPVRMLNEYAYCPRLFHLMHVEGRWADNVYTVEGRDVHRRVDRLDHVLPDPAPQNDRADNNPPTDADEPPTISRSVSLASAILGITGKLDLVSTAGGEAVPVDTKRGRVPANPERSWEPERVQVMAQGLLLREQGYRCDHGVLYFALSRTRVDIPFTPELESRTRELIALTHAAQLARDLPPPLEDSPKCNGCSLASICLPDETLSLREVPVDPAAPGIRRLYPVRDDAAPLYVQYQGARVGKTGNSLVVRSKEETLATARLKDVSQLVLCGNVQVSAQAIHLLCEAGVPIVHLSSGHWYYGMTKGHGLRNAFDRAAQFDAARDDNRRLQFARAVVRAKGSNQRTLLRRNGDDAASGALRDMAALLPRVDSADSLPALLGLEGNLAARYFGQFARMLRPRDFDATWDFATRNRRPPRDPVNAMLSFGYALLAKDCAVALDAEGLDPWWGLYHQPRHGRPALALDLMEEFRPLLVDSAVVTAINTGRVRAADFTRSASGCIMDAPGRKSGSSLFRVGSRWRA